MAIVSVTEYWSGRTSRDSRAFTREYQRIFRVQTSSPSDPAILVRSAVDPNTALAVPQRGDIYSAGGGTDSTARCVDVQAVNDSSDPMQWTVTCTYTTDLTAFQQDPTTTPTIYNWSTEWTEKALTTDLDGNPIANSAHDPFDPPPTRRQPVDVIKATCTRAAYNPATDKDPFIDRVNSVTVTFGGKVWEPGQLLFDDLQVGMVAEHGLYYFKFDYTFKGRTDSVDFNTTITQAIHTPGLQTVSVASVDNIVAGISMVVNKGYADEETITIGAVNIPGLTITATFAKAHNIIVPPISLQGKRYIPWQYQPLDIGYNTWDSVNNRAKAIYTSDGAARGPCLLDGSGNLLALWTDPPQLPFYFDFRTRDNADFSVIVFP